MAAERGSAFLLKLGGGSPVSYATVAGLKTTQLTINGDAVAITNKDSGGWRELLSGAGVRSVSVAASGIFTGSAAEGQVKNLALGGQLAPYELSFESGEKMQGQFLVSRLEYAGDFNGERNYTLALESSGEVVALCRWKSVPIELGLGGTMLPGIALGRRAVLGRAETALADRRPMVLDELSTVTIRLANSAQFLLNADDEALMAGANLSVLDNELIQFGRAEALSEGIFRLSRLLRGRRGTEWAAAGHAAGDRFCLVDPAVMAAVDIPASGVGAALLATAHGIADAAPQPVASRSLSGESLRPPSPCHLTPTRDGPMLHASWTRRTHRGWAWIDAVEVADDPFPELYRLTVSGPAGQLTVDRMTTSASFEISEMPAEPGEPVTISLVAVGPSAPSHPAIASIIL